MNSPIMDKKRKRSLQGGGDFKSKKRKHEKIENSKSQESNTNSDVNHRSDKKAVKLMKKQKRKKFSAKRPSNNKISLPKQTMRQAQAELGEKSCYAEKTKNKRKKILHQKKSVLKKKKLAVRSPEPSESKAEIRTSSDTFKQNHEKVLLKKKLRKKKKRKGRKTKEDGKKTKVTVPNSVTEMSSNWKALAQTLNIKTEKKVNSKTKASSKITSLTKTTEKGEEKEVHPEVWFDDVDPMVLQASTNDQVDLKSTNVFQGLTRCLALDCEMVGAGLEGKDNELARVSIVNQYGACVYDKYVKPREKVVDYRTAVSGIRPEHLKLAEDFDTVQKEVADLLKGRILVGHALHNDMRVLYLSHPKRYLRDTARYKPFRRMLRTNRPGLKKLAKEILHVSVQQGEHNSIEDAQAAMKLYTLHKKAWDTAVNQSENPLKWTKQKKKSQLTSS